MAKQEETYNEAIEKLRKIVAEIENGDLDVDILSEKVKEATRLIKLCKEKLYKVDEEVKKFGGIGLMDKYVLIVAGGKGFVWVEICRSSLFLCGGNLF